jgi:addiction module RelE/StbE family toxin
MYMGSYNVKIYPAAKQDLLDIVDYLNTLSADAALRYYDLLTEQIASLSNMPERCPRPKNLALAAKGYRYLVVEKYLVFYVVVGNTVQIRRIIYGRRDYTSLL